MAYKRDRAIAAFFAVLFIISSSAFTIAIIVQAVSERNTTKTSQEKIVDNKLQGTKLANFTPVTDVPQLIKDDTTPGTGEEVKPGDTITVDYTGAVAATGIIFQSSKDSGQPVSFPLGNVIKGWQDGIPGAKVGGTRRLVIPADQAYGANPPAGSGIPANAPLVFDVTIHKIGQ